MAKPLIEVFNSFSNVMDLLRNERFQYLLEHYERAKKVFIVGYEVRDNVTSEVLFEGDGRAMLKPADYLTAFSEFVKQKEKEIEAIAILLNKPGEWNTKVLTELREKLRHSNYDEANLEKAHKIVYHKDAVDIISMVKHAARETEPLLSPGERVDIAIRKVTFGRHLSDEQQKWMGYIKEHLKKNLTLDENDLKELPVFADRGGLNIFKRVFGGEYETIIKEINKAIAA
jgi:type I restriction enzyme R subunit